MAVKNNNEQKEKGGRMIEKKVRGKTKRREQKKLRLRQTFEVQEKEDLNNF